ncbi:hypothetical protein GCM10010500_54660 [Streptomyces nigrescens]|nr:hypothetical protein GCM10010500_54660 [Streptomyces libani subsp. libani]
MCWLLGRLPGTDPGISHSPGEGDFLHGKCQTIKVIVLLVGYPDPAVGDGTIPTSAAGPPMASAPVPPRAGDAALLIPFASLQQGEMAQQGGIRGSGAGRSGITGRQPSRGSPQGGLE